jgi:oligoendopeptidase F|tara:strand:- start:2250 stop:4046 length:1797 start_codon:yes stop_codon:yes gene_type:complete
MANELTIDQKVNGSENIRWDLTDLFNGVDDPKINESLALSGDRAVAFKHKYQNKVKDLTPLDLNHAYTAFIEVFEPIYRVHQFGSLSLSTNTSDDAIKSLSSRIEENLSSVSNKILFFSLELAERDDLKTLEFSKGLEDFRYNIEQTRKTKKYNLTEKEEQLINLKSLTGKSAFKKMYSEYTSTFSFDFEIDGEVKKMTGAELRSLRQHPNPDIRHRAMDTFFAKYSENKLIFTHIFNDIIKDFNMDRNLRGYPSSINVMNVNNDIDDSAVNALMDVTTESNTLVQRYYKLKRKMLGLNELTLADIYAPLPNANKTYTWNEAQKLVLDAFASFDDEFYTLAKSMFNLNRIDGPAVPNKRGGAFCSSSTPDLKPYVLLNFTGKLRDVSTMAHELGHAIHAMLSTSQHLFNYHPIMPLAETASVFSEMILTDKFLKEMDDKDAKIALLTNKLEDIFATSHRQNMFSRFEVKTHKIISERLMSSDELCEAYREELEEMFGDSVAYSDIYNWEWASIPHMLNVPFYVYAYNFANLLVIALYQQYLDEGDSFVPKFKTFLGSGSSASPSELTKTMGVDINNPDFWRQSMKYIEGMIDQLEELL